jgi:hypothetical protein
VNSGAGNLTPIRIRVINLYILIITITLVAAGMLQITSEGEETFFDAFFNSILAFGYIGYTDNATVLSKAVMCVFIVVLGDSLT